MEIADPPSHIMNLLIVKPDGSVVLFIIIVAVLLILSALVSGAESAFFSLSPQDTDQLKQENSPRSKLILDLLNKPKELLANTTTKQSCYHILHVVQAMLQHQPSSTKKGIILPSCYSIQKNKLTAVHYGEQYSSSLHPEHGRLID